MLLLSLTAVAFLHSLSNWFQVLHDDTARRPVSAPSRNLVCVPKCNSFINKQKQIRLQYKTFVCESCFLNLKRRNMNVGFYRVFVCVLLYSYFTTII